MSEEEERMYHKVRGPDEGQWAGPDGAQRKRRMASGADSGDGRFK